MRSVYRLILFTIALLTATACGQNTPQVLPTVAPTPTAIPPTTTPITPANAAQLLPVTDPNAEPGRIRIVHAAADTPTINVNAGFMAIATNLGFTQSTEPTPLDAGEYPIQIMPSGSRPGDIPLFDSTYTLASGGSDIVVVAKNSDQYQLLTFPEQVIPLNANESVITFINAVSGSDTVTVQQNADNLTDAIPFGASMTSGVLPSGATTLNIQAGGSAPTAYEIDLVERQHYTLILAGQPDAVTVGRFSTSAPGRTLVRALHAAEGLEPVDIYLNEQLLAAAAAFSRPNPRETIISGEYQVSAYPAGAERTNNEPLANQTVSFEPGQQIALLLVGEAGRFQVVSYAENLSPTPPGQARIAFFNTLPSVSTLHVESSGGPLPDVPDTGFGQAPQDTLLSAESHNFYLTRAGASEENQTVETVQNVQLRQGTYYLYFVTGRQDDQPIILSEDVGIDAALAGVSAEEQAASEANEPVYLRFVNAIADQTAIDFLVNTNAQATAITYGEGSDLIAVRHDAPVIEVLASGSGDFLQSLEENLDSGERYTILAYGPDREQAQLMIVPDNALVFDGRSPHLRLIHVSSNIDTSLGFGFSAPDPTPEAGGPAPEVEVLRRSIPSGVQRLVDGIAGGAVSNIVLMPTGVYDIEILDSNTQQLATTLPNLELESGIHYDIVVYEAADSIEIRGFIVAYPVKSG